MNIKQTINKLQKALLHKGYIYKISEKGQEHILGHIDKLEICFGVNVKNVVLLEAKKKRQKKQ